MDWTIGKHFIEMMIRFLVWLLVAVFPLIEKESIVLLVFKKLITVGFMRV